MNKRAKVGRGTLMALAIASVLPVLAGCPKKPPPPVEDAAPPPPPVEAGPVELVPLDAGDDGAADADADVVVHHATGPAVNPSVAHLKQCCAALNAQAAALQNSPESQTLKGFAAQCGIVATQVGPSGNAPELAAFRQILRTGKGIPAICQGL